MAEQMTLTKQEWEQLSHRIATMGAYFQEALRQMNHEGKGEEDAKECASDIICALSAINYVAHFAADKCIFVGV